jgi:integrase
MRRTMILTDAATALRVSEVLALQWHDLDFEAQLIRVRQAYVERRFVKPKSKASKAPVPMHPLLAAHFLAWRRETPHPAAEDLVFPSLRLKGKRPPAGQHVGGGLLTRGSQEGGSGRSTPHVWLPHLSQNAGFGSGEDESRHQDGAGDAPAPEPEDDPRGLRQGNERRQTRGAGHVP